MSGSFITPCGDVFFVPSLKHGILEIDARSLAVKRVVKLPNVSAKFLGGFARNDDSFMVNMGNRLFVTPASGDGGAWSEVILPEITGKEGLDWKIEALGPEFFVGSSMNDDAKGNPLLMAGKVRDGKLSWVVASNRRPAVNPLDAQEPRNVTMAFRSSEGKTHHDAGTWQGRWGSDSRTGNRQGNFLAASIWLQADSWRHASGMAIQRGYPRKLFIWRRWIPVLENPA